MRKSNNEQTLPAQGNAIDKQFYYNLLSLEKAIIKEPHLDAVQQALAMYRKCVEYFDNIQDPIKYYFLDKIQQALSETKTLMLIINSKSELESSKTISPVKRTSMSDLPSPQLSDQQVMDKKLRSKQVTLQIKLHEAADQQSEILNTMVTDFTTNTTSTDQKVRQDLNQQADIIQARLLKRQQSTKIKGCSSMQTLF
ncbi:unnamed protein product [Paramecium octaurelia]|uniref:Uncharacterized protein n=1 Tax=Paramecium octaurelia TaxID=43137 RepID=A0A8S1U9B3_PAROT|nr:unnamed protein product [Paramecium octaurelia]